MVFVKSNKVHHPHINRCAMAGINMYKLLYKPSIHMGGLWHYMTLLYYTWLILGGCPLKTFSKAEGLKRLSTPMDTSHAKARGSSTVSPKINTILARTGDQTGGIRLGAGRQGLCWNRFRMDAFLLEENKKKTNKYVLNRFPSRNGLPIGKKKII